ncbi:SDR family NAD(P)-dependent oxidoreductase [Streptomyces sp. NPDC086787]|uniref:SDR family NAD(P)-dependent oxidoreductase n=1 Tax=Streptomyces sp. NPDC086787 TaxID=3365759 RepID=UPI003815971C
MSLSDRTVVVTGAGSGIGRATCVALSRAGARVGAVGRRKEPLAALCEELRHEPGDVMALPADVGSAAEVEEAVRALTERSGPVTGIVNNAGLARFAPLSSASLSDLDAMFAVHVRGPVNVLRACLPSLREHGGAVVNVSSVGGALAMPDRSLYGATKAAVNSLTRSWAQELAPRIRVNAILPGPVDTSMYADLGLTGAQTETLRANLIASTPLGRFGRPAEVARWITLLLDEDESGWITGALVPVDGGRTS